MLGEFGHEFASQWGEEPGGLSEWLLWKDFRAGGSESCIVYYFRPVLKQNKTKRKTRKTKFIIFQQSSQDATETVMDMLTLKGERRSKIDLNAVNRPAHRIEYWCTVLAEEEVFKRETFGPSSLHLSDY